MTALPGVVSFLCWIGKCDILYQLICRGKTTGFSSKPARCSRDNCQRMSDFDSCQSNNTYTDGLHNWKASQVVQDLLWHLALAYMKCHLPLVQNLEFILSDQLAFHHDLGFDWLKIISWNLEVVFSFLFVKKWKIDHLRDVTLQSLTKSVETLRPKGAFWHFTDVKRGK